MTRTPNALEDSDPSRAPEQAGRADSIVDDDRAKLRRRPREVGMRGRAARELDALCGVAPRSATAGEVDYCAMGFDLGWRERRAAGLVLLEQERAA